MRLELPHHTGAVLVDRVGAHAQPLGNRRAGIDPPVKVNLVGEIWRGMNLPRFLQWALIAAWFKPALLKDPPNRFS